MFAFFLLFRYGLFLFLFAMAYICRGTQTDSIFAKDISEKRDASTTFFITPPPQDVKKNRREFRRINRSISKMDYFSVAARHQYNLQNLGNIWTAAQPIFYMLPKRIGAEYGFSTYDFYFRDPRTIRYYHTPNAYAHLHFVLANLSTFLLDTCYTQRILPNWYAGLNFIGTMTENEWPSRKENPKIVDAFPQFDLFTYFKSPNDVYYLFTSYSTISYITRETGGIRSIKTKFSFGLHTSKKDAIGKLLLNEQFMESNILPNILHIQNKDNRHHFYLYHQIEFNRHFQLYHEFHYKRTSKELRIQHQAPHALPAEAELPNRAQKKEKKENAQKLNNHKNFISNFEHPLADSACQKSGTYNENSGVYTTTIGNEIGIKGDAEPLGLFYRLYYRLENIDLSHHFSPSIFDIANRSATKRAIKEQENYLGFNLKLTGNTPGMHTLHIRGSYLFTNPSTPYYAFKSTYKNDIFTLAYKCIKHKVPYLVQWGFSQNRPWNNHDFKSPFAQEITTKIQWETTHLALRPLMSYKKIHNYIYFDKIQKNIEGHPNPYGTEKEFYDLADHCVCKPMQVRNGAIDLFSWGGDINLCLFSHFHFDHYLLFLKDLSKNNQIVPYRMPRYMYTLRYYYAAQLFNKKWDLETGFNIHFKERYYADGYDIISQQFYQQNEFTTQGMAIVDFFVNFKISNFRASLKYSYINSYMLNELFQQPKNYYATPFYPGQKPSVDIGIYWSFFD